MSAIKTLTSQTVTLDLSDTEYASRIFHALSTQLRLNILLMVNEKGYYINEIAEALGIPASTAALNVRVLEEAGLIMTSPVPGNRGTAKLCSCVISQLHMGMPGAKEQGQQVTYSVPIGSYSDCVARGVTCGLVSETGFIGQNIQPASFFEPEHIHAQLLWFHSGYVEYRISNYRLHGSRPIAMRLSFEACSEIADYNLDWPSDIFVSVNGVELGVWTSPGDMGGRHGLVTPEWWTGGGTQFGFLKTWEVNGKGTRLDGEPLSGVAIDQLGVDKGDYFTLRIGVREDACNVGGMNLFGEKFGDHPQAILLQFDLETDNNRNNQ